LLRRKPRLTPPIVAQFAECLLEASQGAQRDQAGRKKASGAR